MKNVYYKDIIKSDFNITEYLKELISEIIDEKFGKIKETQEIEKEKEEVISDLKEKEQPGENVKIPVKYNYADIGIKAGDILYFYFQHDSSIAEEHQNDPPMAVIVLDPVKKSVKIMGNEYSTVNKFLVENSLLKPKQTINAPWSLYTEEDHFNIQRELVANKVDISNRKEVCKILKHYECISRKGYNWCLTNHKMAE